MEFTFDCRCGETITDFARGDASADLVVVCSHCDSSYAVTVTQLQQGSLPADR